jgi:phospho-N-acetylmuramoyl-pentapeptide-transferase
MTVEHLTAFLGSLVMGLILGYFAIPLLRVLKFGQIVRSDGPSTHLKKTGTPTMGGIIFLAASLATTWFVALRLGVDAVPLVVMTIFTLGFGLVGLADDALKVVFKRPLGLLAREKLLWQFLLTGSASLVLTTMLHDTALTFPFVGWRLELGLLYWPFLLFLAIGFGNAVNITDGVDGLAGSTVAIASLAYLAIGLVTGSVAVVIFSLSLIGALLAFLYFNRYPAKVIMGDVGSLALGGALTSMAVLTKTELLLVIVGFLFVLEAFSVIIQVLYFRFTGGKRFFRMAPLHHHLELGGWSERKIVSVLSSLGVVFAFLGLLGLTNMGR